MNGEEINEFEGACKSSIRSELFDKNPDEADHNEFTGICRQPSIRERLEHNKIESEALVNAAEYVRHQMSNNEFAGVCKPVEPFSRFVNSVVDYFSLRA